MSAITIWSRISIAGATLFVSVVHADVVTDWNATANDLIVAAEIGPPSANRALAIAQVAVFDAVNAITGRYPPSGRLALKGDAGASVDAAVAAAMRGTLRKLLVAQQSRIDAAYETALARIPDNAARRAGVAVGESAAAAVLTLRDGDGAMAADSYVPFTQPGVYVPTTFPAVPHWGMRKPWILASGSELRPGAPPALSGKLWARDYNEIKAVGGRTSTQRSAEQTQIARFWEATQPVIYYPLARAVALQPGREVTQNSRLIAAVGMAIDDALIAVFDAKYAYAFWRPVTAIRNGDKDGNDATAADPTWTPFIDTPLHPEYPCAHCVVSAALAAVLRAEIGGGPVPRLSTTSPTAPGVNRSWASLDEFTQEVANARIYDGVHFRNSTEVGTALGRRIGERVATKVLQ